MQVQVTAAVANFLVNEARRNFHEPANLLEEQDLLIYNYAPEYTGKVTPPPWHQPLLIVHQQCLIRCCGVGQRLPCLHDLMFHKSALPRTPNIILQRQCSKTA